MPWQRVDIDAAIGMVKEFGDLLARGRSATTHPAAFDPRAFMQAATQATTVRFLNHSAVILT